MNNRNKIFIQQHWVGLLAIIGILIFFFITRPFGCNPTVKPIRDTVTNTVYVPQPPVVIPTYVPIPSNTQIPVIIPPQYQPSPDVSLLKKQYQDLVNQFISVKTYNDSIKLKDSSGKQVGIVNLNQKVSENEIKSNDFSYKLAFPHTTTTITIKEPYQPRFQVLIGGGLTGNMNSFINGGYLGVGFKNKRDQIYLLNGGVINQNGLIPQFGVSTYVPISFRKKR